MLNGEPDLSGPVSADASSGLIAKSDGKAGAVQEDTSPGRASDVRHGFTPMAPRPVHTKSVSLLRQLAHRHRSFTSGYITAAGVEALEVRLALMAQDLHQISTAT